MAEQNEQNEMIERESVASAFLEGELAQRAILQSTTIGKEDSHPQSLATTERLTDDTPAYERLLKNVPDKLSAPSPKLTNLSEKRWEALRKTLKTKCGIDGEEITEAWLHILLKGFVEQPAQNRGRALPDDRNDMFAAIFWKYMQGADTHQILGAAARHNMGYARSPIGAARTSIVTFAVAPNKQKVAPKRQLREEEAYRRASRKVPPKKGRFVQDSQYLADLDALNRGAEQAAEEAYARRTEGVVTDIEWLPRVSEQLATHIGDTEAAYSQILGVRVDDVADDEIVHTRGILWDTILKNVAARAKLTQERQLTNRDVQLLAFLCGKKLIVRDKKLVDVDVEPLTVRGIQALVQRSDRRLQQQIGLSPDAAVITIHSALNKLIEFRKKTKRK